MALGTAEDANGTLAQRSTESENPRRLRVRRWILANPWAIVIVVLAGAIRLVTSGGISGLTNLLGYDPGVYYAASSSLLHGEVPYRDFIIVHPPGITLLLTPFALLAEFFGDVPAFALSRIAFILLGCLNALLIYIVARRVGKTAAVVAGLFYCVQSGLIYVERNPYLEVPMLTATLVGLLIFNHVSPSRRRLIFGGCVFGLAVATKLWAAVPLLVISIAIWIVYSSFRKAFTYLGSAVVAGTVIMLPFFLLAPGDMISHVLLDQVGRPGVDGRGIRRIGMILSVDNGISVQVSLRAALVLMAMLIATLGFVWIRERRARVWVALCAVTVAVVMLTPTFFDGYKSFYAIGLILVCAAATQLVWNTLAEAMAGGQRFGPVIAAALGCIVLAASWSFLLVKRSPDAGTNSHFRQLTDAVSSGACVTAERPNRLIMASSLTRSFAAGCPPLVDATGVRFGRSTADFQAYLVSSLNRGDFVILGNKPHVKAESLQAVIAGRPIVMKDKAGKYTVYGPRQP